MLFLRKKQEHQVMIKRQIPAALEKYHIQEAERFYYADDSSEVFSQYIIVPKFTIWFHVLTVKQTVAISPTPPKPGLKLNFMLGDINADAALTSGDQVKLRAGEANMFYVSKDLHDAVLPPGKHIFFHLDLEPHVIQYLVKPALSADLLKSIKKARQAGSGVINRKPVPNNIYFNMLIQEILQHDYKGTVARIYLRKKAELLLLYFIRCTRKPRNITQLSLTPFDIDLVDKAKMYVKQQLEKQLSTNDLSESLGINNPVLLLRHFHQLHDLSLHAFDKIYRMEEAFRRVVKSQYPLHFIARRLGYKNTATFSRSFRSYFGCNPALLRNKTPK
jgi:AraC-like DNA-binding protein